VNLGLPTYQAQPTTFWFPMAVGTCYYPVLNLCRRVMARACSG
jgi:hypothetical protein